MKSIFGFLTALAQVQALTCPSTPVGKYQAYEVIPPGSSMNGIENLRCWGGPGNSGRRTCQMLLAGKPYCVTTADWYCYFQSGYMDNEPFIYVAGLSDEGCASRAGMQ
jgi:hypothetical protein